MLACCVLCLLSLGRKHWPCSERAWPELELWLVIALTLLLLLCQVNTVDAKRGGAVTGALPPAQTEACETYDFPL